MTTPQGWANLLCLIPRVAPGLLEVNAAGIDMQLSFSNSKIYTGHCQLAVQPCISTIPYPAMEEPEVPLFLIQYFI